MAHRPSTVDRLPEPIRELIGSLRQGGHTIDEIMAKLSELQVDVSRSAVGRHVKTMGAVGEKLRETRAASEYLISRLGDDPDTRVPQLTAELLHSAIFSILTTPPVDENGVEQPMVLKVADFKAISEVMRNIAQASKTDADRVLKIKAEAKKEAVAAVERVAKQGGLSRETVDTITRAVLGVE